jgi:ribulose-5-phosphate 4-epimerase/fuculose-1-phosphate aldolase
VNRHAEALAERSLRRRVLAAGFRAFSRAGFDEGIAGHATARDPIDLDTYWVNPALQHFSQITAGSLLRVDARGTVVEGVGRVNPAALAIHAAIHQARPDVVAAVHMHSVHGRALAALPTKIAPLTQDACAFYEDHGVYDEYHGVVLDASECARIVSALGCGKGLILRNHGLLTVGTTVASAAWWFLSMERSCQVQLIATAAGVPVRIPHAIARRTHSEVGTEHVGQLSFAPIYARIVSEEPGVLDETPRVVMQDAAGAYGQ